MLFLSFLGLLFATTLGWVIAGASLILILLVVYTVHEEVSSGRYGYSKWWWTLVLLSLPLTYLYCTGKTHIGPIPGTGANDSAEHSLAAFGSYIWNIVEYIGIYLGIGLLYVLPEFQATLYRDRKDAIVYWDNLKKRSIISTVLSSLACRTAPVSKTDPSLSRESSWSEVIGSTLNTLEQGLAHLKAKPSYDDAKVQEDFDSIYHAVTYAVNEYMPSNSFRVGSGMLKFNVINNEVLPEINKTFLLIRVGNWVTLWWAYLLNLIFGDMLEMVWIRISTSIVKYCTSWTKRYFSDVFTISSPK